MLYIYTRDTQTTLPNFITKPAIPVPPDRQPSSFAPSIVGLVVTIDLDRLALALRCIRTVGFTLAPFCKGKLPGNLCSILLLVSSVIMVSGFLQ